ncbi:hypothetical protein GH5_02530 [Leishmania sp. Ghana 2012 LV757]|uniref:hypothetical protein n=1 Tax=Leishmania sp. Ghana 2012 LV757 TaxID=2803181 RepID=UPI001B5EFF6F|nr:hypothetical protein GH5_02530 [Leishmania sp. Ghana 2012 LV757]
MEPSAERTTTHHCVRLEGAQWGTLLEAHSTQLEAALLADVATSLHLSKNDITNVTLRLGSLIAEMDIRHEAEWSRDATNRRLASCPYTETWALYQRFLEQDGLLVARAATPAALHATESFVSLRVEEQPPVPVRVGSPERGRSISRVTKHRVRLEGDAWEAILQQWRELLMREFTSDVCDATSLLPASVQGLVLSAGSLTADFQLSHEGVPAGELNQLLADAPFTRTWALYQRFLEQDGLLVARAATPAALHATESFVSLRVEEQPPVPVRVGSPERGRSISRVTKHRVRLEGDAWEAILQQWRELLMREFTSDVCDATSLLPASVQGLVLSAGSLTADFQLSHEGVPAGELNQLLADAPFTRTWALYQRFLEQEGLLVARAATPAALHATESFVSLRVEEQPPVPVRVGTPEELQPAVQRATPPPAALHATESFVSLRVGEQLPAPVRVGSPERGRSISRVTKHHVRLEGDAWEAILQQWRDLLMREFTSDVCDATSLLPASVQGLVLSAGSLTADFQLSHEGVPAGELNQLLADAPFTRTWALYQRFLEQDGLLVARAATPAALHATESFVSLRVEEQPPVPVRVGSPERGRSISRVTKHHVRLEGDAWEAILQQWRDLLMREFTSDVCDATSLLPASVQGLVLSAGSLTADFQLSHEGVPAGELNQLLADAPFTRTWALYQRFLEQEGLLVARAATPAALHATESFVSLRVEEQPPVPVRVGTPEELQPAVQRATPPPAALHATESFVSLRVEEQPPVPVRVGTPEELQPAVQRATPPPAVLHATESFVSLRVEEQPPVPVRVGTPEELQPAVQRATPPPAVLHATESFVSLRVEEQPPVPVRVGTPEELQPAVQRATPPPAVLHATESFVSLRVEEQPPVPVRVGTPEELQPAVQRATPPPAALHATESFVSLRVGEQLPAPVRVGSPERGRSISRVTKHHVRLEGDAWEAILQQWRELLMREFTSDVCDATSLLPASVQGLVLSAGSLTADFQLSHEGVPAGELNQLLADAPFTRTWALYQRFLEQEGLLVARAATPAALHATESFVSLRVGEQPPVPVRVGSPERGRSISRVTKHHVRLEGDAWEAILQQWRELLIREFTSDVCDATSLLPASVQGLVLSAGSLTADFQLSHEGVPAGELNQLLADAPFTRTWALYQRFLEQEGLLVARAATPAALHATESFVSLRVEEQPPVPVRVGTPEELQPAVQRATPPPAVLHATESFVSLRVEEQPPVPVRVGTPEELQPAVQRATPPPAALHATESFVSLRVEEQPPVPVRVGTPEELQPAVQRATPPPAALHATESFVSLRVEEQPPVPVRVGTPEELQPAVQRATPPPAVLHATESFVSLRVEEQPPVPVRVGTPEELQPAVQRATPPPAALHATESFVSLRVEEQPPVPVRVGTPEELQPAVQRATPPPAALHATESFVSLRVEEQPPAPVRVGSPERGRSISRVTKHHVRLEGDAWEAILQQWRELLMREFTSDVCDATSLLPASVQGLVLSAGSLTADFQLSHEGVPAGELNQLLADAPFTRTWALYQRFLEQEGLLVARAATPAALHATESFVSLRVEEQPPVPVRVGTPEELQPAVQRATPPPAALHATESFVSLRVEEQPPVPVRVGTPEELQPAVQRATPPPAALHATESFVSLRVEEQPPVPVRVGTPEELQPAVQRATPPPAALHATESFVSLRVEEQPPVPVRVGTPEELQPAVQRATPPPAALHATESFVSLRVEEQPPVPVRVGTPEELQPAVQRATPPPAALHATESFVSLRVEEQPPAPVRVGSPERGRSISRVTKHHVRLEGDAWEAILQQWRELLMREFTSDVCDATSLLPASVQGLVLSAGSLTADFQLSHEGVPAGELNQLLADAPFTRTWALYQRFLEQEGLLVARAATPAALHATESFVSLRVEEQPPVPVRVGTPEELQPAVQRATPPPAALHATESFVSLRVEEQPPVPVRVGTPEELQPAVQRATPPPAALHATESFVSLRVEEQPPVPVRVGTPEELQPAVQRATPPPAALHATESFVSLRVEEQPPVPVRVGTPEELQPAVQRATPPPAALHATESFVSLRVEEQPPVPVRVGTPEELQPAVQRATPPPAALHATESFVSLRVEEQPPVPVRVGTPEELQPAVQRATPPPAALHATESFVSLRVEEQPPAPVRVGSPERGRSISRVTKHHVRLEGDAWEAILQQWRELLMREFTSDVCDATSLLPASVQGLVLSAGSLTADFQLSHEGVPAGELNQLLADAPFTRTWALYQRFLEQEGLLVARAATPAALHATESFVSLRVEEQPPVPVRVGTPEELQPAVQRATPPPAALHATESFVSLRVEEQPPVPVRVGTPEELQPAVQRATPPPAALHATESFVSLRVEEQPPVPVRVGTPEELQPAVQRATPPPAVLHATESFVSLRVEEQPPVPVRVGTPEELQPAVQRATPPPAALHATESFVSLRVEEQPPVPVRVGTPEELQPAVQRATPPPAALHATESFVSLRVEEQPPAPVRVGSPERGRSISRVTKHHVRLEGDAWEAILQQWRELLMREFTSDVCDATSLLPASVQGLVLSAGSLTADFQLSHEGVPAGELNQLLADAPFTRTWALYQRFLEQEGLLVARAATPAALHATESFVSLRVEEQPPVPVRVGTPEELQPAVQRATPPPAALHATESFVSLRVEEQPPVPVRVGTPEELQPAVQRATPPPAALHATESFVSLRVEEQPPAPVRVGSPERGRSISRVTKHHVRLEGDAWEAILQQWRELLMREFTSDVCDATSLLPASVQGLVLSAGSLTADFQLSHEGVPAGELNQLLADAPFTRTWALYQRFLEQEGLLVARAATPAALHATESFVSLRVEEQPPVPVRVGTPEELQPAVQRATPPPAALHATESFVSLRVEEQPPVPVRVGTPEELQPAVQRATPPPAALHATESFVSLRVEEQPPVPVRVGTPEELQPAVQRATPPPAALHATESFVSLRVEEQPPVPVRVGTPEELQPAVQRATPPPAALHATESFVSLRVEEQPPVPVRVGTPEELQPAVQRATPPPAALHATESFVSLRVEEQPPVPVRVGTPEELQPAVQRATPPPAALHATESFVSLRVEEQPPVPVRVGTPEELQPAVQRATPPPAALHATESFVSLRVEEQPPVPVRVGTPEELQPAVQRATPPPAALHATESFVSLRVEEQPPVPVRVGTPEELQPAVQRATPPPAALHATESFVSLRVEEQPPVPVRVGTPEELQPAVQRATPPPAVLHATESFVWLRVEEQPPVPVRVGTPEELQPAVQRATPPPAALHATESFVSLRVEEQPPVPVRVGTPEELQPAVQRATPPPAALHATESFVSLRVEEQPPVPVRVGTPEELQPAVQRATPPPAALHATESFVLCDEERLETASVAASVEAAPARELSHRASEPQAYSRDDLADPEAAVLNHKDERPKDECLPPQLEEASAAASVAAAPARELSHRASEPQAYSRDDLADPEAAVLSHKDERPKDECLPPQLEEASAAASVAAAPARELSHRASEPQAYSRDDLADPEAAVLSHKDERPKDECLPPQLEEARAAVSVAAAPARELSHRASEPQAYSRDDLADPEAAVLSHKDERPKDECLPPQLEEASAAASVAAAPARELSHRASEPQAYSRDDLADPEAAVLSHKDERPKDECLPPQLEEASAAASVAAAPARELSHRASEPQAYSRDDLADPEAAVLSHKDERPKDECLPPQLEEARAAVSVEAAPARELSHRASEPQAYSRDDLADPEAAVLNHKDERPKDECLPPQLEEARAAVSVEAAPARELSHRASEPQAYSRDDLADPEAAVLSHKDERPKDECLPPQLEEARAAVSVAAAPARELSHRASEPQAYSRDDLADPEAAVLNHKDERPKDECLPPQLEEARAAVSVEAAPARELSHRASEPQAYSRDDLADPEAAVLSHKDERPKDECLPPQLEEARAAVSVAAAPARELSHRASEPQAYSRDDLADPEAAVLSHKDERPKDECLPPQLEEARAAVSVAAAPARELSHRASEPQAYSRDDLADPEAAVLNHKDERPKDECLPPQLEEARAAVSVEAAPARELSHRASEPQAYSRDDLAGPEAAVLNHKDERPKDECLPPQLEEARAAVSVEAAPARELSHRASEPQAYSRDDLADPEAAVLNHKDERPKDECLPPQLEEARAAVSVEAAPARELSHRASEPQAYSRDDLADPEAAVLHKEKITVGCVSRMLCDDARRGEKDLVSCSTDAGVVEAFSFHNGSSGPGGSVCAYTETLKRSSPMAEGIIEVSAEPRVSRHTVTLHGRHWFKLISFVVADALRRDVAIALCIPLSDVQQVEMMSGSLIATFAVVHSCDKLTASDVDRLLEGYHFPLTWEHYPTTPETTVGCVFEAEELSGTRRGSRTSESAVKELLAPNDTELCVTDSCELKPHPPLPVAEEASRSALSSCGRTYSAPMMAQAERESVSGARAACIAVSLSKKHSTVSGSPSSVEQEHANNGVSEPSIELSRNAAPAPATTAVMPPEVTGTVSTKHRVGFVGKGWTSILKTQKDEFVAAVIKGTGEKLGFALDSVDKVHCNEDTGDTIVTFHVTHPSALPSKHIDVVLRSAPYADVWKLYYESAPPETQEKTDAGVTTFHRVGFVGGTWKDVISRDFARFSDAFVADSATALSVTPQAVKIADYAVADDIVVDFYVSHPVADSEELIDSKLEQFDYQRVWDLYGTINQVDEQQRVVPCVMKRSPTSRLKSPPSPPLVRMPLTSSIFPIDGFCPSCRRRFSPQQEFPQSGDSGSCYPQPVHSHASSVRDTVRATLTAGSSLALGRPSPLPQIARRISPHESWEWPALQPPSVQRTRGTSLTRSAQTVPRAPWYPSGNNLTPHPPRTRSPSKTKRRHQRRINLRELESEVSRRQRQRKHQERQEQLDREMRRSLNCSRSSLSAGATTNFPRSFLPTIPARYTKVRPSLQHRNGPGFLME